KTTLPSCKRQQMKRASWPDPQVSEPVAEPATLKALWGRSVALAGASLASASQHVSRDVSQPRLVYPTREQERNTMTSGLAQYDRPGETSLYPMIVAAFFASGFAALIYQIIWQRALFTIFGINVEAVTVVVTGFLLGLGFGSLSGGWLSRTSTIPL